MTPVAAALPRTFPRVSAAARSVLRMREEPRASSLAMTGKVDPRSPSFLLVSCCCCNELPRTQGLKARIYFLTVLEIRSEMWAKTKVARKLQPLETLAEDPFPSSFQLLETSLVRGPSFHLQRWQPSIFRHLSNPDPPAFPFIRTLVTTLDSTPLPDNP